MARRLEVEIIGDSRSLERALGRSSQAGSRFGSALRGVAKGAAFAIGGAALGGIAVTLRQGISEFSQAAKVSAQTAAALRSTGGAANVTAKEIDALASSLMRKSGIDDEAIKSGENLLLTFTNIRNEAGKGNDIFNQATRAITDMSVALGQDMKSSAIQAGKALNDPIKGVTALQRVGVSFTAAQKDQIKALVESGKTMDAQKLILRELNKEFGGSAEAAGSTLPGKLNILKETFNNLAGDLIAKAVPAVTSFVGFIADKGLPKLEQFFGVIGESVGPALAKLGEGFKTAGPAIMGVIEPLAMAVRDNIVPVFLQLQDIGVRAIQAISKIIKDNGPELRQIFENLGTVIANLAKIVIPLLDFAFTKVLPVAIKILIPILVVLTEAIAKVSSVVRVVATAIEAVLIPAMNLIISVGGKVVTFLTKTLAIAFAAIEVPLRVAAGLLKAILAPAFDAVSTAADGVRSGFEWFSDKARPIFSKLAKVLPPAVAIITAPFETLRGVLVAIVNAMNAFVDRAGDVINLASKIRGAVGGLVGKIPGLQSGGPALKGRAYLVGEHGPELFVPGSSGMVIPNLSSPRPAGIGSSSGITINVSFPNYVGSKQELIDTVRRGLYDVARRNPGALPGIA